MNHRPAANCRCSRCYLFLHAVLVLQGSAERDPEEAGINAESHNRSVTPETWAPAQEMIHLSIRTGAGRMHAWTIHAP